MSMEDTISIDFGNQGPIEVTFQDLAEGPHKGRIEDAIYSAENKGSYRFVVTDLEDDSPTKGVTGRFTIGADFTSNHNKKGGNRHFNMNVAMMANLLASVGIPVDQIKGKKELPLAKIIGRDCYFVVVNPAEEFDDTGKKNFQDRKFCTPAEYNALKKGKAAMRSAPKSNGAAKTEAQPVVQPSTQHAATPPPPTPAPDLGDLFNN